MSIVYGENRDKRKVHDEACQYTWKKTPDVEPWECGSCSDAEWFRDNMIASVQAQWSAHALDHMDSEACRICRNFDSLICRMQRKPFAPVGVLQAAYGAEPYEPTPLVEW